MCVEKNIELMLFNRIVCCDLDSITHMHMASIWRSFHQRLSVVHHSVLRIAERLSSSKL